jgi:hypothetical protein
MATGLTSKRTFGTSPPFGIRSNPADRRQPGLAIQENAKTKRENAGTAPRGTAPRATATGLTSKRTSCTSPPFGIRSNPADRRQPGLAIQENAKTKRENAGTAPRAPPLGQPGLAIQENAKTKRENAGTAPRLTRDHRQATQIDGPSPAAPNRDVSAGEADARASVSVPGRRRRASRSRSSWTETVAERRSTRPVGRPCRGSGGRSFPRPGAH